MPLWGGFVRGFIVGFVYGLKCSFVGVFVSGLMGTDFVCSFIFCFVSSFVGGTVCCFVGTFLVALSVDAFIVVGLVGASMGSFLNDFADWG